MSLLFHDLIPFALPECVADGQPRAFARYMSLVRSSTRIATVSQAVRDDLRGMAVSYRHQGIPGPQVESNPNPIEGKHLDPQTVRTIAPSLLDHPELPLVLSVSSIEPRKNQLQILLAAELLWREGLQFQLLFIAGSGWKAETFHVEFERAVARGRPIKLLKKASEDQLWAAYHLARFTVFVSFNEGFGLPAAESIYTGTPVVLSNLGSMAEIGAGGGAEFVDPLDLDDITSAMRRLLTDDGRLEQLRTEATQRHLRTWDDFATGAWAWLVEGRRPA